MALRTDGSSGTTSPATVWPAGTNRSRRPDAYGRSEARPSSRSTSALTLVHSSRRSHSDTRSGAPWPASASRPRTATLALPAPRRGRPQTTSSRCRSAASPGFLVRRDQLVGSSVCGARSTPNTRSKPAASTTSRTPTSRVLHSGTRTPSRFLSHDSQHQVELVFAFDLTGLDVRDHGRPMIGITTVRRL